jgi:hypothetical protein
MVQYSLSRNSKNRPQKNDDIFEVNMIANKNGDVVTTSNRFPVDAVLGGAASYSTVGNLSAQQDAFGRLRISHPHTIFDSSFRYPGSNNKWNSKRTGTTTVAHNANQALVDLTVGTASGDEIVRETDRTFGYQPGKSLFIMNTMTFASAKNNLRQRVGYFGKYNGIYLEQDGLDKYIVKRSYVTGEIVNTRIPQSQWNVDKLDGTGLSGVTIDLSKSHIFWVDIEWLGVGSVRSGFVINGQYIICHIFHHANETIGTYITTATLPIRYEITNTGATESSSMLKQICSTVISEGGYEQIGITRAVSNPITGKNLTNSINNPMISIKLRENHTDAVVIPRLLTMYGIQNTGFVYKIIKDCTLTNASWNLTDSGSAVEYDLSATGITGGTTVFQGVFFGQETIDPVDLSDHFNHGLQLTRKIIEADSAGDILTFAVVPTTNNDDATLALTWQEITQ